MMYKMCTSEDKLRGGLPDVGSAEIVFGEGDVRSALRHVTSLSVSVW